MRNSLLVGAAASIGGCRAFSFSSVPSRQITATPKHSVEASLTSKLGFSFTPGGLLFPFHLGVAKCLEREGFLARDTPLAGSSAG